MAVNKKITELSADTDPTTDDLFVMVNDPGGTPETRKITGTNATKALAVMTGDSGSGGVKGLVPAPAAGDAAAGKFLKANGAWVAPSAGIGGSSGATDNAILRADGTGGSTIQNSAITVDDNGAVTVPEIAAPSTPASGKVTVYAKSDGKLYIKDDAGTETDLTSGGGGGSPGGADGDIQYRVDASTFGGGPLIRLDANTIEQRNGATTQELRIYQTWTSSTNNEGFRVAHSGATTIVGCFQGSGGGSTNAMLLQASSFSFETGTSSFTPQWELNSTAFQPANDNAETLGTESKRVTIIHLSNGVKFFDGATNTESPFLRRVSGSLELWDNDLSNFTFLKDAGRLRVAAQFDKTDTTLATVTGLTSQNLKASTPYSFEADLFIDADATGGFKFAIAGTATATSIEYQIMFLDNAADTFTINSRQTALGGSDGAAGPTAGYCRIKGTILVNAAGTISVQFAQNAANGTSSVRVNSTFRVEKF